MVLSLLGLLVVMATAHDTWRMCRDEPFDAKKDGRVISALHCFSAVTNGRRLLSMKSTKSSSNLACVHGIRVLSTCWVVIGHSWIIGPASNSINPSMVKDVSDFLLKVYNITGLLIFCCVCMDLGCYDVVVSGHFKRHHFG